MSPIDKPAARRMVRARRADHVAALQAEGGYAAALARIAEAVAVLLPAPGVIAAYVAIGGEVDPRPLLKLAHDRGWRLALPHVVDRIGAMRFLAWPAHEPLHAGPLGLSQPVETAEELRPDVILAPLTGFDRALNRLGQGAGHYDRAFANLPHARRIGLAWSVQEMDALPIDPWDLPLDAIVTERETLGRSRS